MTAGFKKSNPSCTQSYRASLVANAILLYRAREAANKCVAEELERTSDSTSESATKSTKRRTYEKYTPHSHNKASPAPCPAKLGSNDDIFNTKINNFSILECFTKLLCLKNLELFINM